MNREIKFRVFDKGDRRMKYADIEYFDDMIGFRFEHRYFEQDDNSDIVLMQYTGLQDKSGQECYHKDILRSGKKLFIVEWQNEEARFLLLPTGSNTDTWKFMDEIDHMEIIGNIYETPTLAQ
jgi:uncharacterized protein (DUF1684 family)